MPTRSVPNKPARGIRTLAAPVVVSWPAKRVATAGYSMPFASDLLPPFDPLRLRAINPEWSIGAWRELVKVPAFGSPRSAEPSPDLPRFQGFTSGTRDKAGRFSTRNKGIARLRGVAQTKGQTLETVEEYRRRAEDCEQLARKAQTERHRREILKLAETWRKLAADRERKIRAGKNIQKR